MPHPVLTDMNTRLQKAAIAVDDARDQYRAALEVRDELVEAAVDHGMSQRKVAQAAGVAISRVTQILLHRGAPLDVG